MSKSIPTELKKILVRNRIRTEFPPEALEEVHAIEKNPGLDDGDLRDLTHLAFVTIDNQDSKDLDQAMYLEKDGKGYVVYYALADASYYVRPGSALFAEALKRGASFYLPGLSIPMLPRRLSEGLVSLNPDVDRRALVFIMNLDEQGSVKSTNIVRAKIHSVAKLTYSGVQLLFDSPNASPLVSQTYTSSLMLLRQVGNLRLSEARHRDVVRYNREETEVEYIDNADWVITTRQRLDVDSWNEQISLMCNSEGAAILAKDTDDEKAQAIYRIHEPPEPQSLKRLQMVLESLAKEHGLDPKVWCWNPGAKSLAHFLEDLPDSPSFKRINEVVQRQALLVNHRSVYSAEPGMHYALGVTPYARFSSPMREIVGIFTHKEALEKLHLVQYSQDAIQDEELRKKIIQAANQAKELQRRLTKDVMKLALDVLWKKDLRLPWPQRPERKATIMGISHTRMYVRLDQPPADMKIYLENLSRTTNKNLVQSDDGVKLVDSTDGTTCFRIGDELLVKVDSYDRKRRRWHIVPVEQSI